MALQAIRYRFRQPFRAPARAAFEWCTAFEADDSALLPYRHRRRVRWLANDALILTDTRWTDGRPRTIRRLVRIHPYLMAWTNTHLDGPFRHSQFWYRIFSDGPKKSHLEFEGLQLMPMAGRPTRRQLLAQARALAAEDSALWRKHLGPALERSVGRPSAMGAGRRS
jgi:hypothetical protein